MKNAPSFQFYPADLISDPDLLDWDMEMIGLYWWIICYLWVNGGLIESKPSIIQSLTRRKRIDKAMLIWNKIKFKFTIKDGYISHKRVTKEMQKQEAYRLKKINAGKVGADKRWHNQDSANDSPIANDSSSSPTSSSTPPSTSIVKEKIDKKEKFIPPTIEEVTSYFTEKNLRQVTPEYFFDFYESKNWMVGKNKMSNWKSAANRTKTWEKKTCDEDLIAGAIKIREERERRNAQTG